MTKGMFHISVVLGRLAGKDYQSLCDLARCGRELWGLETAACLMMASE